MKRLFAWMKKKVLYWLEPNDKTQFIILKGIDRLIIPKQTNNMERSMNVMGIIRPVLVAKLKFLTGTDDYCILDGKHLYLAAKRLGAPIPYFILEIANAKQLIEVMTLLNGVAKPWAMKDYVRAWGFMEKDYKKLMKYHDSYDLDISVLASVLSGQVGTTGYSINRKLKTGEFRIVNEDYNSSLLKMVKDVLEYLPNANRFETKYVCNEYLRYIKNCPSYNHKRCLARLKKNKSAFALAAQIEGRLLSFFEEINK